MTERGPSLMIPGEWEPRRRSIARLGQTMVPHEGRYTRHTGGPVDSVAPPLRHATWSPASPPSVKELLFVGALLASTLILMWQAASIDR